MLLYETNKVVKYSYIHHMFTESIIQENFYSLERSIDSKSLLNVLFADDVITSPQLMELTTLTTHNANTKLLNILCEMPITSFKRFLNALKKTNQLDIYSALVESGFEDIILFSLKKLYF